MFLQRGASERICRGLVDLLYPPECAWCQVPSDVNERLCAACRQRFESDYYRCLTCAAPLPRVALSARIRIKENGTTDFTDYTD